MLKALAAVLLLALVVLAANVSPSRVTSASPGAIAVRGVQPNAAAASPGAFRPA